MSVSRAVTAWVMVACGCGLAWGQNVPLNPARTAPVAQVQEAQEQAAPARAIRAATARAVQAAAVQPAAEQAADAPVPEQVPPADPKPDEPKPAETDPVTPPPARQPVYQSVSKIDPSMVKLHLMDGSIISGKLSIDILEVDTEFGSLKIPITSLKSFTPGLASHPQLVREMQSLIEDLGSSDFGQREAAQKTLIRIGLPSREYLQKRADDRDTERRTRIKALLEELDDLANDVGDDFTEEDTTLDRTAMVQRDTIETTEFTMIGQIVPQSFDVVSPYGPLNIKLSDVRKVIRDTGIKPDIRKSFGVDGSHIVMKGAYDTKIRVERGDKITVEAEGNLTMTPWGNRAISTPDGAPNYGWYIPNDIPGGMLIARIGDNGEFFKVGARGTITATKSGILQFCIAMQADYAQNAFPGKYNVKLLVKPRP